ncbi:hypothetical protein C8F01DRAFT_1290677 [Mycena amicta]|nr:hypothetical protein C8F01DRAFT_1321226 [Mycena amicta]KAJ7060779.1 hypothetical protein C8F01DRAFT_1290677 [Mycena amicta]
MTDVDETNTGSFCLLSNEARSNAHQGLPLAQDKPPPANLIDPSGRTPAKGKGKVTETGLSRSLRLSARSTSGKQAIYLNLLFKSIKADVDNTDGVKAIIRRFVQVLVSGGNGATEFIAGGLYMLHVRRLLSGQPLTAGADLSLNTISHFLDRFVYKNPRKIKSSNAKLVIGKGSQLRPFSHRFFFRKSEKEKNKSTKQKDEESN